MKILLADDEQPKLDNIQAIVCRTLPGAQVLFAKSVRSAIRTLREISPDLVLLDMSLPTFDVAPGEPGGRGQGSGGIEVLRYMRFYKIASPVMVITQYGAVEDRGVYESLPDMCSRLRKEHGPGFHGIIHYGSGTDWEARLVERVSRIMDDLIK